MRAYDEYIKYPLHYPKVAIRIKSHLTMYPNCKCNLWLPNGTVGFRQKTEVPYEWEAETGMHWQYLQYIECSNCVTSVSELDIHLNHKLVKEVFVFEYVSHLLETNAEKDEINLCNCCYKQFKEDFRNLA
jgi:hypothetical protein